MERALALTRIRAALANAPRLPTAEELVKLLADLEVALFLRSPEFPPELLQAGWYLHGIAQAEQFDELYPRERRLAAWQVSAHIFDLALEQTSTSPIERLRFAFASQLGYLRGELHPNAIAIYSRVRSSIEGDDRNVDSASLGLGISFLGMHRRGFYEQLSTIESWLGRTKETARLGDLRRTHLIGMQYLAHGCRLLMRFMLRGDAEAMREADEALGLATRAEGAEGYLDSRWVAANLRRLLPQIKGESVWNVLPPGTDDAVKRAFVFGRSPVLMLWPPQVALLRSAGASSPLEPSTKRLVLSVPTSGGKTLISQLLAMSHISGGSGSVCFVVPTRSLARELRQSLSDRLRLYRRSVGDVLPDWFGLQEGGDVDVVTPERLALLLRTNTAAVLEKYGLFIFDEVHSIADDSRGLVTETTIALLHSLTQETHHRLMVMSAAIGNRQQIAQWIDPSGAGVTASSEWRGPRRLLGVYTTAVAWQTPRSKPLKNKEWPSLTLFPLHGTIRLRLSASESVRSLRTTAALGEFAVRTAPDGTREKGENGKLVKHASSTAFYKTLAKLALLLGQSGTILIVRHTRRDTQLFAETLAADLPLQDGLLELATVISARLGAEHPLARVVQRGVVFHHAGLPSDTLSEVEDAIRGGRVTYVVATTSLTDGVNLPVRTVIVEERTGEYGEPLTAAQILNALGRAGRACIESAGWAILARQAAQSATEFSQLSPSDDELRVSSVLSSDEALSQLAAFEEQLRINADSVLEAARTHVASFISYVWLVLSVRENLGQQPQARNVLPTMLAWSQLSDENRTRWQKVAEAVADVFQRTDPVTRARWVRTPTSLSTARQLDLLAIRLVTELRFALVAIDGPFQHLQLLQRCGVLDALVRLPEAPSLDVYDRRAGKGRQKLQIDLVGLLSRWLQGAAVGDLAEQFFGAVLDLDHRYEQLSDYLTSCFEHHLAWTCGLLIERANTELAAATPLLVPPLDPQFASFVRYGVGNGLALTLLHGGIRSRRLAQLVSTSALSADAGEPEALRAWLISLGHPKWVELFGASAADIGDLMAFVRDGANALASLFEGASVDVPLSSDRPIQPGVATLRTRIEGGARVVFVVYADGRPLAEIPEQFQADALTLVDVGLPFEASVRLEGGSNPVNPVLSLRLARV